MSRGGGGTVLPLRHAVAKAIADRSLIIALSNDPNSSLTVQNDLWFPVVNTNVTPRA